MRVLRASTAVATSSSSSSSSEPAASPSPEDFDLEEAYDEAFRRACVLRVAPAAAVFEPLSLSGAGSWERIERVPGAWAGQLDNANVDPAFAGLYGQDLAEMVLARLREQRAAPAESAPAESAPAESAPAESAPAESAPAVADSALAESAPAESAPAESAPSAASAGPVGGPDDGSSAARASASDPAQAPASVDSAKLAAAAPEGAAPTGWGKLDQVCPEEYKKYRANPTEENFNKLVAAFALPQYRQLRNTLQAAHGRLQDPDQLAALASDAGLEGYELNNLMASIGNLEFVFAELPDGQFAHGNMAYMGELKKIYPGRNDYSQFDFAKMTKEQLLAMPVEKREMILRVLDTFDKNSMHGFLASAIRTFARMNVDATNYESAKIAAVERHGQLMRENPELIALLNLDSPFAYDLCARAAPHTYRFDGAGFRMEMDSDRQAQHVYARIAAMGPGAFVKKLDETVDDLYDAINQFEKTPEFQKLAIFAIEVTRLIGADAESLGAQPEADAYRRAFNAAKKELDDARRERKWRDVTMAVFGGLVAFAGLVALLHPAGWVVAGVAAATGLGHALLEGADLFDKYYSSRFNIEGYADVNGVQPPTVADWALTFLDLGTSALDLKLISAPFRAALKSQMLELTFEGAALERSAKRLQYFDDPEGLARYLRGIKNYQPEAKTIMAQVSEHLSDEHLIRLGHLLMDESASKNLEVMMKGLTEPVLREALLKLTGNLDVADARAQLALLARVQKELPGGTALLNKAGSYERLEELRQIGSPVLINRWFRMVDPPLRLEEITDFRRVSMNAGVDGDALIRTLNDYDHVMLIELAASKPSATAMQEVAEAIDLARERGLDTTFRKLYDGYGENSEFVVFGPVMIAHDYDKSIRILGTSSDRGRAAMELHATRDLGPNYDLSAIYDYSLPRQIPVGKQTVSGALGKVAQHTYDAVDIADEVNKYIKMPPEVFQYSANGVTKTITIHGPFTTGQVEMIKSNLRTAARLNPELLAGTREIHYREHIGFYAYENQPIDRYDFLARSEASKLYINPAGATNPEELFRELGRDLWVRRSLAYDYQSPFVRYGDSAAVSWLGATGPEENFAEAVRRVIEDQADIRRDPADYLTRVRGYADTPLEARYVEEQMAYAIYVVLGIRAEARRDPPPAPPPGGGGGPY